MIVRALAKRYPSCGVFAEAIAVLSQQDNYAATRSATTVAASPPPAYTETQQPSNHEEIAQTITDPPAPDAVACSS